MTKKELIAFLNANFADNDEVFVMYEDDHGECVASIDSIRDVKECFQKDHFEVMENGNWIRWENPFVHPSAHFRHGKWRRVLDREWSITKKCICVK